MSKPGALIVFFLICSPLTLTGLAQTPTSTTEGEPQARPNLEAVKAKGIALLSEIEGLVPQIRSPGIRLRAQLEAAEMLLDCDEKRAAKWLADAIAEYKQLLAAVDLNDPHYPHTYHLLSSLRQQIVHVLAAYDPDAALGLIHATTLPGDPYANRFLPSLTDSGLELSIAKQVIRKDPKRAVQIARQTLKKSYSSELLDVLSEVAPKDRALAAELADEIATKLSNERLLQEPQAAQLAVLLIQRSETPEAQVRMGSTPAVKAFLVSEEPYKNLLQKLLTEALSYSHQVNVYNPERNTATSMLLSLKSLDAGLDKFVRGGNARVEKKLVDLGIVTSWQNPMEQYEKALEQSSGDAALHAIESVPTGLREQLYFQLASRYANDGDVARATQIINDRASTIQRRLEWLSQIELLSITRALNQGNFEEAIKKAGELRSRSDRAQKLAEIVDQIGAGQKRSRAITLLEQARSMLGHSPQAYDGDHLDALIAIALAFSRYDSKRSFEILEPLIDQFNEICAAARTLDGFGSEEYYVDEELDVHNDSDVAHIATLISDALGELAVTDFERAKSATERIRLLEVRVKAYLTIAQNVMGAKE